MYYIKKYSNGWPIHNDATGSSRLPTALEIVEAMEQFPELLNDETLTVYTDEIKTIDTNAIDKEA